MEHVYVKLVSSQQIPARATVLHKGHIEQKSKSKYICFVIWMQS